MSLCGKPLGALCVWTTVLSSSFVCGVAQDAKMKTVSADANIALRLVWVLKMLVVVLLFCIVLIVDDR